MTSPGAIDLLMVDDDEQFRSSVVRRFVRRGYNVQEAGSGTEALALANRQQFDVAVVDLMMPSISGIEVLQRLKELQPECQVLLLTGQGTVETAVQAMKLGAYDYLTKPSPLSELESLIEKAATRRLLAKENHQLKELLRRNTTRRELIGNSSRMLELKRLIARVADSGKSILIQGESGTGKELVAQALHDQSQRADKPWVVINCAALTETLLESELFGHEKGAFTGAVSAKPGLFEVADEGTLFIDEVGEMPASLQAKLLRVLEDGSIRRVGSVRQRRVNVRVLAATNRDLAQEVRNGNFREDLYYRINVMSLETPPLRERIGDISLLTAHLLGPGWTIDPEALGALERYSWPGNVRQLLNALERAKIMAEGRCVMLADLPREISGLATSPQRDTTLASNHHAATDTNGLSGSAGITAAVASSPGIGAVASLALVQRAHIVEILQRERGNKARTARALGVNRRSLYRLLEKYQIDIAAECASS